MFLRALDDNGDITFSKKNKEYAVEQLVKTRLQCIKNDFFLDLDFGIDLNLMDTINQSKLENDLRQIILNSEGVVKINSFSIILNDDKTLQVFCNLTTKYSSNINLDIVL
jgi:hypothetical protein